MLINNLDSLFFQAGTWCVSDCKWCFRQFWNKNIFFAELINNICRVVDSKIFSGNIMIYNIDYFSFSKEEILQIQQYDKYFKKISFHTDFRNVDIDKIFPDIDFVYQKNFSLKEIIFFLDFLKKWIKNNVLFAYWCIDFQDIVKMIKILKFHQIKMHSFLRNDTELSFCIGDNYSLKFFIADRERYNILNCYFQDCIFVENNAINFWKNFYLWYLEVQLSWNIRAHEPPCGFWDLIISNIYKDRNEVINDFQNFSHYIKNLTLMKSQYSQSEICKICKNKKFHYENSL